jgi:hypothetical protein
MAYQQAGGMLNNAANAAQSNEQHGPQGAEYTLQGMSNLSATVAWLTLANKALCASSRSNGTTTSEPETHGTLNEPR